MRRASRPEGAPLDSKTEDRLFVAAMLLGALVVIVADQRAGSPFLISEPCLKLIAEAVIGAGLGGLFACWAMGSKQDPH